MTSPTPAHNFGGNRPEHQTIDPTPVPDSKRGAEAPVSNDPGPTDPTGGTQVKR